MKYSKFVLVSAIMFLLSCFTLPALAGPIDECAENDFVHCLFSTDQTPPGNPFMGNYIRMSYPTMGDQKPIECLPYGSVIYFDSESANEYHFPTGRHEIILEVCSDAKCTYSTKVADDIFTVSKDSNSHYSATPRTYSYAFSGYYAPVTCKPPHYKDKEHKLLMIKQ